MPRSPASRPLRRWRSPPPRCGSAISGGSRETISGRNLLLQRHEHVGIAEKRRDVDQDLAIERFHLRRVSLQQRTRSRPASPGGAPPSAARCGGESSCACIMREIHGGGRRAAAHRSGPGRRPDVTSRRPEPQAALLRAAHIRMIGDPRQFARDSLPAAGRNRHTRSRSRERGMPSYLAVSSCARVMPPAPLTASMPSAPSELVPERITADGAFAAILRQRAEETVHRHIDTRPGRALGETQNAARDLQVGVRRDHIDVVRDHASPSPRRLTGMGVDFANKSTSMLSCLGSRCCTSTKPIPVSAGRLRRTAVNASSPPADAPIPTTGTGTAGTVASGSCRAGAGSSRLAARLACSSRMPLAGSS